MVPSALLSRSTGRQVAAAALKALPYQSRTFFAHAFQSLLWNTEAAARMDGDTVRVREGTTAFIWMISLAADTEASAYYSSQ